MLHLSSGLRTLAPRGQSAAMGRDRRTRLSWANRDGAYYLVRQPRRPCSLRRTQPGPACATPAPHRRTRFRAHAHHCRVWRACLQSPLRGWPLNNTITPAAHPSCSRATPSSSAGRTDLPLPRSSTWRPGAIRHHRRLRVHHQAPRSSCHAVRRLALARLPPHRVAPSALASLSLVALALLPRAIIAYDAGTSLDTGHPHRLAHHRRPQLHRSRHPSSTSASGLRLHRAQDHVSQNP